MPVCQHSLAAPLSMLESNLSSLVYWVAIHCWSNILNKKDRVVIPIAVMKTPTQILKFNFFVLYLYVERLRPN